MSNFSGSNINSTPIETTNLPSVVSRSSISTLSRSRSSSNFDSTTQNTINVLKRDQWDEQPRSEYGLKRSTSQSSFPSSNSPIASANLSPFLQTSQHVRIFILFYFTLFHSQTTHFTLSRV